jgi:glycine/D-amino acid oxidase-like deaminating enzyme
MASDSIFAPDFKEMPYWIDASRAPGAPPPADPPPLPEKADVVVVGGGLTGVSAGHELASGGRDALVLDANEATEGASSRNAGMLGWHSKHYFTELCEAAGVEEATRFFRELRGIYDAAVTRIHDEKLDCDFRKNGRFLGALSAKHHARMTREYEARARLLGEEVDFISHSEQVEIGSKRYHGGVVVRDNASIQPAKHVQAMRRRAEKAGARVIGRTRVIGVRRENGGFEVVTERGTVRARDVMIATNGYSGNLIPWLAERLVPINAYMVATEPLSENMTRSILPNHRMYSDNRRRSNYMQLSPDRRRLLFGGQTGRWPVSLREVARRLHDDMVMLFPELDGVKLSYAWTGRCAATWDYYPRVGTYEGMHYALGYCFSGNAMGPYLGIKAARRILGKGDATTFFDRSPFPYAPRLARSERLMSVLMNYYAWADRPVSPGA